MRPVGSRLTWLDVHSGNYFIYLSVLVQFFCLTLFSRTHFIDVGVQLWESSTFYLKKKTRENDLDMPRLIDAPPPSSRIYLAVCLCNVCCICDIRAKKNQVFQKFLEYLRRTSIRSGAPLLEALLPPPRLTNRLQQRRARLAAPHIVSYTEKIKKKTTYVLPTLYQILYYCLVI